MEFVGSSVCGALQFRASRLLSVGTLRIPQLYFFLPHAYKSIIYDRTQDLACRLIHHWVLLCMWNLISHCGEFKEGFSGKFSKQRGSSPFSCRFVSSEGWAVSFLTFSIAPDHGINAVQGKSNKTRYSAPVHKLFKSLTANLPSDSGGKGDRELWACPNKGMNVLCNESWLVHSSVQTATHGCRSDWPSSEKPQILSYKFDSIDRWFLP